MAMELSYDNDDINRLGGLVALMADALLEAQTESTHLLSKIALLTEQQNILLRHLHRRLDGLETDDPRPDSEVEGDADGAGNA